MCLEVTAGAGEPAAAWQLVQAAAASRELGSFRNPHSKLPTKSVGKLPILQVLIVLFSPYFPLFLILPSGLTHHLRFVKYKKWLISANLTLK